MTTETTKNKLWGIANSLDALTETQKSTLDLLQTVVEGFEKEAAKLEQIDDVRVKMFTDRLFDLDSGMLWTIMGFLRDQIKTAQELIEQDFDQVKELQI